MSEFDAKKFDAIKYINGAARLQNAFLNFQDQLNYRFAAIETTLFGKPLVPMNKLKIRMRFNPDQRELMNTMGMFMPQRKTHKSKKPDQLSPVQGNNYLKTQKPKRKVETITETPKRAKYDDTTDDETELTKLIGKAPGNGPLTDEDTDEEYIRHT